ncbi:peptide-N4-(N-acetyl-beta-glucosaminyl)asparagine amidase A-like [Dioscorea cayenensis subsp. rotundata]|uniref:Peptide-N4-(N-acetyl-beta- glucosaminyl)asparagine amidase A-like n=1 Tax=Dioscorea cayennensis subsp. rotundata TaxID=55577 RepID=A0AB40BLZ5_DIOCR|nr:peptide-N4-(N-acetyl-beta-glucosaminyl)asparagine amidase A-like [Dioscorea cayenensis subsp. rotundata]
MNSIPILLSLLLSAILSRSSPDHFILHRPITTTNTSSPQEYFDPSFPSILLPAGAGDGDPSCSHAVLSHSFAHSFGSPPISAHLPPCNSSWSTAILDLTISSSGEQYDRIAAIWINGAEILRTSTAEPTPSGVFWSIRKDITRYAPLLRHPTGALISVMLENIIDETLTGVYNLNLSIHFYSNDTDDSDLLSLSSPPLHHSLFKDQPDLILPISNDNNSSGFWFRIENETDLHYKTFVIPSNTYRAILEVFISSHGDDEFWYSNPPNIYIDKNNLTTTRGNGAFRNVFITIDDKLAGTIMPFPVIFTGGINPLFWSPIVAIGAFDLPSYHLDITPFLGVLLDGEPHELGFGVTNATSFWLIDANLHLWLDPVSDQVEAELIHHQAPPLAFSADAEFKKLNGTFKLGAETKVHVSGWVNSSHGNLTIDVEQKMKYKSLIFFRNNGDFKEVLMKGKLKTDVKIKDKLNVVLQRKAFKAKYPLYLVTYTLKDENSTSYTVKTNLSHSFNEKKNLIVADNVVHSSSVVDTQNGFGWMRVEGHSVLDGMANTEQSYRSQDSGGCRLRKIGAKDGEILYDNSTNSCAFVW